MSNIKVSELPTITDLSNTYALASQGSSLSGKVLLSVLQGLVSGGYVFMGIATSSTDPGNVKGNVFYLASENGTYTNFNNISVFNEIAVLYNSGNGWKKQTVYDITENLAITSDKCSQGYFDSSAYEVGSKIPARLQINEVSGFKAIFVKAKANTKITVCGRGSSASSRLYVVVNSATQIVEEKADAGANFYNNPKEMTFDHDCDVYLTFVDDASRPYYAMSNMTALQASTTLGDTLFDIRESTPIANKTITENLAITSDKCSQGYFDSSAYEVGSKIPARLQINEVSGFKAIFVKVLANTKMVVCGRNNGASSRLYVVVNSATQIVEEKADARANLYNSPKELTFDHDCDVYLTFTDDSSRPYYAMSNMTALQAYSAVDTPDTIQTEFIDYAITANATQSYPMLDTAEQTLLFKKNATFYGRGGSYTFTEDTTIKRNDAGYSSHYIVIDFTTGVTRHVRSNSKVELTKDEMVLLLVRWETGIIQGNIFKYYLNNVLVDFKLLDTNPESEGNVVAPKMYNFPLNIKKEQLRILDIGNSYTEDATHYLPNLTAAASIDMPDMCLYSITRASGSFKTWIDCYNDEDNAAYSTKKVIGGIDQNTEGTAAPNNGELFRNILNNNEWDLIIIHQVSNFAPYYDEWETDTGAGYFNDFIRLIRRSQPGAAIGFLLVHSYWSDYPNNTERSSIERWKLIANSVRKLRANYGIDFVIPYGTAIQNLRSSSLNNEYDLTIDGTHCADGLADYTAACTYFNCSKI